MKKYRPYLNVTITHTEPRGKFLVVTTKQWHRYTTPFIYRVCDSLSEAYLVVESLKTLSVDKVGKFMSSRVVLSTTIRARGNSYVK